MIVNLLIISLCIYIDYRDSLTTTECSNGSTIGMNGISSITNIIFLVINKKCSINNARTCTDSIHNPGKSSKINSLKVRLLYDF